MSAIRSFDKRGDAQEVNRRLAIAERMNRRLSTPRLLAFWGVIFSFALRAALSSGSATSPAQSTAARLSLLSGILLLAAMTHRQRTGTGILGIALVIFLIGWCYVVGVEPPREGRLAFSLATACAATLAVVGTIVPLRMLASAKAWLLSVTIIGSWFLVEASLSSGKRFSDNSSPQNTTFDKQKNSNQQVWSMGNGLIDPVKGSIYRSLTSFKCYYHSNPRGTFADDPILGPLDNRLWVWERLGDLETTLIPATDWQSPFILEMKKNQPSFPKAYSIAQLAWVKPGLRYKLDIAWMSDRGMSPLLELTDERDNRILLETKLNARGVLNPAESISFETPVFCTKVKVAFLLGAELGRFELTRVELNPDIAPGSSQSIEQYPLPPRYSMIHRMNSEGFRDREHPREAKAGVYRIAFVGDSVTLGQGVEERHRFSNLVEEIFRSSGKEGEIAVESLNFGICGHCTEQEVVTYEHCVRPYKPDMVFVMMVSNDALPYQEEMEFHRRNEELRRAWEEKSALLGKLSEWNAPLPDYSRSMAALRDLAARCERDQTRLVVCLFRNHLGRDWGALRKSAIPTAEELDIPLLDLGSKLALETHVKHKVHETDGHPNEIEHRTAAEMIVEFLRPMIQAER